jgi:hypothetical protein
VKQSKSLPCFSFATAGGSSMRLVKIGVKVGIDLASPMDL